MGAKRFLLQAYDRLTYASLETQPSVTIRGIGDCLQPRPPADQTAVILPHLAFTALDKMTIRILRTTSTADNAVNVVLTSDRTNSARSFLGVCDTFLGSRICSMTKTCIDVVVRLSIHSAKT